MRPRLTCISGLPEVASQFYVSQNYYYWQACLRYDFGAFPRTYPTLHDLQDCESVAECGNPSTTASTLLATEVRALHRNLGYASSTLTRRVKPVPHTSGTAFANEKSIQGARFMLSAAIVDGGGDRPIHAMILITPLNESKICLGLCCLRTCAVVGSM